MSIEPNARPLDHLWTVVGVIVTLTGVTTDSLGWVNAIPGVSMPRWAYGLIAFDKKPAPLRNFETAWESRPVFVSVPD